MKIIVTGVTGYVGSHVTQQLIKNGHQVVGLIRDTSKADQNPVENVTYIDGTLQDMDKVLTELRSADGIVHAAAGNGEEFNVQNGKFVNGVLKELEHTNKAFLMQGGSIVFGDTGKKPLSDADGNPLYHNAPQMDERVELEKQVLESAKKGVRPIIVYGSLVFGGSGAMIPNLMKKTVRERGYSPYVGEGATVWSSVHIEDWANLMALALENEKAQGQFMAESGCSTIKEVAEILNEILPESESVKSVSLEENEELWDFFTMPFSKMNQNFESGRAKSILDWKPKKIDLREFI